MIYILVSPLDYVEVTSLVLSFGACQTRECIDIVINDDNEEALENIVSFSVTLGRTPELEPSITLGSTTAEIQIIPSGFNNNLAVHNSIVFLL